MQREAFAGRFCYAHRGRGPEMTPIHGIAKPLPAERTIDDVKNEDLNYAITHSLVRSGDLR
jgi:hypothetical protein